MAQQEKVFGEKNQMWGICEQCMPVKQLGTYVYMCITSMILICFE